MILQSCSFILSFCWAVAVAWISYATTWSHQKPVPGTPAAAAGNQAAASAVLTAVVAFLAAWAVLGFLASLLLNVIDSLFVCFAMDRDAGQVGGGWWTRVRERALGALRLRCACGGICGGGDVDANVSRGPSAPNNLLLLLLLPPLPQVSSVEVHAVLVKLPTVGAVVQQPVGGIAYGATAQPQEQQYPPGG